MKQGGTPHQSGHSGRPKSFLARLASDARGNTLAIVGAAFLPLTAMIGGGVDISRAYMAKARLQGACDAASLAGRRVMTNDTLNQTVIDESRKFFNFNFPQGLYGTAAFTPTVTKPSAGTIAVSANTTIPTGIMHLFGYANMDLAVACEASQNFVSTDIMLVLDVTGSMADPLSGTPKIAALKDAVMALYDELAPIQTQLEAAGMRLRYGVVPYSSAVNVGAAIRQVNAGYIASSATYQSRSPIYRTSSTATFTGQSSSQCNARAQARTAAYGPATQKTVALAGTTCTVTTFTWQRATAPTFDHWIYEPVTMDTTSFKTFANNVPLPTRTPGTNVTADTWDGCIEERQSVNTITPTSGYNIPAGATDLNINMIPTTDATRWKPHWSEVIYNRTAGSADAASGTSIISRGEPYYACPAPSERLKAWQRSTMQNYVNSLLPIGGTYHDIGMIWGARLISAEGAFGDSPETFNGMPVAKHIIFMTDGALAPNVDTYTSYGVENLDNRIGTTASPGQRDRHNQRFKMICNAAKGMNVSIWVIAFDAAADANLTECASSASQVSVSTNRAQLIAKFTEIGKNIGALRLTQ